MNTANNQRHQETERRLLKELLRFLEQEQEPTVGQLCQAAGINRSTFYRHYLDIYDLMEKTELEIQRGLIRSLSGQGGFFERLTASPESLEPLIRYIGENRHFYKAYLQNPMSIPMREGFELVWENKIKPVFLCRGVQSEAHMRYYFSYVQAGFTTVMRRWLEGGCAESPEEMAAILYRMLGWTSV